MDKKAEGEWLMLIIFLIIIFSLIGYISLNTLQVNDYNNACKELGFKGYRGGLSFEFCIDSNDNLHYIKMSCSGFPEEKCIAKKIKVGDVEVAP